MKVIHMKWSRLPNDETTKDLLHAPRQDRSTDRRNCSKTSLTKRIHAHQIYRQEKLQGDFTY